MNSVLTAVANSSNKGSIEIKFSSAFRDRRKLSISIPYLVNRFSWSQPETRCRIVSLRLRYHLIFKLAYRQGVGASNEEEGYEYVGDHADSCKSISH